ncbi:hypothetical protein AXG93_1528s1140 [Marchantia polymorpha subsp. ruderalis]|uniref:Uncharacterized protein n=1 Tax=Marchantia polymorpha subsp. ruderalis TaxID=1480154 RepID=A0A176VTZ0_MARPO|nr:hypothetical protein AXG93_1528s1140 [Marchantia polymorpha subsp. ruderalis]
MESADPQREKLVHDEPLSVPATIHGMRTGNQSHKSEDRLFTSLRSSRTLLQLKTSLPGKENDESTLSSDFFGTHYEIRHNGDIFEEAVEKRVLCFDKEMAFPVRPGVDQAFVAALLVITKRRILGRHER